LTADEGPGTRFVTAGRRPEWTRSPGCGRGVVNPPVWRASTVLYSGIADMEAAAGDPGAGLFYGRRGTPTQWALADALDGLEPGSAGTLLYPSGVAALTTAILACAGAGDHVLVPDSAYDPTTAFCLGLGARLGLDAEVYDPLIGADVARLFRDTTRLLILESPGSLSFEVQDVPAMAAAARAHGITTLLDNTWAASHFFKGIAAGCDLVMQALTKYVGGHSDLLMGSVSAVPSHLDRLRAATLQIGHHVSPDDAALALRGLRTLPLRLARHETSALMVARWLADQPLVERVLHPALESCEGHDLWKRDFTGASGLFGVVLKVGTPADAGAFFDELAHFGIGYSWGGYESLAIPTRLARLRRIRRVPAPGLTLRLSIGLEDPQDLIADLDAGLRRLEAACG
jgi:cystathionine beta-lyase